MNFKTREGFHLFKNKKQKQKQKQKQNREGQMVLHGLYSRIEGYLRKELIL